jgi:hypothetical protein
MMKEETAIAASPPSSADANNLTTTTDDTEEESGDDCSTTTDELTESFRSFENFIKRKLEIAAAPAPEGDGKDVDGKIGEVVDSDEKQQQIVAIQTTDEKGNMQPQFGYFVPLPVDLIRKRVKR